MNLSPQDSALQITWGKFLLGQHRNEEARDAFAKAVALDPRTARPRVDLGDVYLFVMKAPQKAVEAYKGALAQEPGNVGVLVALAKAQYLAGQREDAKATIERAIAGAPGNPLPLMAAGEIAAESDRDEEALAAFDRAIAAAPQSPQPGLAKAALLLRMGKRDEALTEYAGVLKRDPKNILALVSQAVVLTQEKRPEEARQSFAAAIRADPQVPRILNDIAWTEAERKGDLDRALILAREAVSAAPDVLAYRDTLGWVRRARGELKEAEAELTKAAAQSASADILTHLAVVRAELNDREGATQALHRALSTDPKYPPALELQRQLATAR